MNGVAKNILPPEPGDEGKDEKIIQEIFFIR